MKIKRINEEFRGAIEKRIFSNILFEHLSVINCKIVESEFISTDFKNCLIGKHSRYTNCTFRSCKFYGRYSSLGSSSSGFAIYESCNFLNCTFTGTGILDGTQFVDCEFSGTFKNIILRDREEGFISLGTQFVNCNLSGTVFKNLSIYGNRIFSGTVMPLVGLRQYVNHNGSLTKRAHDICSRYEGAEVIAVRVIFTEDNSGQNPIILDDVLLTSLLDTDRAKNLFAEIVDGYEITRNY